jgi:hypothetical protein
LRRIERLPSTPDNVLLLQRETGYKHLVMAAVS